MRWSTSLAALVLGMWCCGAAGAEGLLGDVALSAAILNEMEIITARSSPFNPGDILGRERTLITGAVVLSPSMAGIQGRVRLEAWRDMRSDGRIDTSAVVQELYTTFSVTEGVQATVGKSFLAWDVSYASRPVNFFALNTDCVDLEDHRLRMSGVPIAALSWTGRAGTLVGVVASDDAEETGRGQWAFRAQGHAGAAEVAALVRGQFGGPIGFGGTLTCVQGRSLEMHGSLFVSHGSGRRMHRIAAGESFRFFGPEESALTSPGTGNNRWVPHLVVGGQYTTESLFNVLVEYIHDGSGLSGSQWERLLAAADFYSRAAAIGSPQAAVAGNLGDIAASLRPRGTRRDYLFVRGSTVWGEIEGNVSALIGLADGGVSLGGNLSYQSESTWDVRAEIRRHMGPKHSEFGEVPERMRLTLMLRFLF